MILFFFGPPGAGKGTQAKLISKELNIIHLSTGDMLRDQLSKNNYLSTRLKKIMDSGQLVSDDISNQIISERLKEEDCKKGFILDGYPRTMAQALFLNNLLAKNKLKIDYIFEIYIDDKIIIKRITGRAAIENRGDDSKNIIKTRLLKYHQETKIVSEFYKKELNSVYYFIDGDQEITKLNLEILKIVKN